MKYKHQHGTKNPVIEQEEKAILLAVDRALSSSPNSQTVGRNGELPLLTFFNRYLPPTFRAVSGHFMTPNGNISPQIDVMILDSRYPLLAENIDGSVLAMLHSVIQTIEVKTNLTSNDIKKISSDTCKIRELMNEIDIFKNNGWSAPIIKAFAYRIKNKLETIEHSFQEYCEPETFHYDLVILRLSDKELNNKEVGCELHYELFEKENIKEAIDKYGMQEDDFKGEFLFGTRASYTPLSDIYYALVQDGYYTLGDRNFTFDDIGSHIMDYMSWSTAAWSDLY